MKLFKQPLSLRHRAAKRKAGLVSMPFRQLPTASPRMLAASITNRCGCRRFSAAQVLEVRTSAILDSSTDRVERSKLMAAAKDIHHLVAEAWNQRDFDG